MGIGETHEIPGSETGIIIITIIILLDSYYYYLAIPVVRILAYVSVSHILILTG